MLGAISGAIEVWGEKRIQQGGVRYRAVSHGRTTMLLGSPIRVCAIVEENGLRAGHGMCEGVIEGVARRRRDAIMVSDQAFGH